MVDFLAMSLVLYAFAPDKYPTFISIFYGSGYEPTAVASIVGTAVGFTVGLVFNYFFSLIFVFTASDTTSAKTAGGFLKFAALSAIGLVIHVAGMYIFNGVFSLNEWIVKIVLTAVVLLFNYVSRKFLLFNKKKTP